MAENFYLLIICVAMSREFLKQKIASIKSGILLLVITQCKLCLCCAGLNMMSNISLQKNYFQINARLLFQYKFTASHLETKIWFSSLKQYSFNFFNNLTILLANRNKTSLWFKLKNKNLDHPQYKLLQYTTRHRCHVIELLLSPFYVKFLFFFEVQSLSKAPISWIISQVRLL